MKTTNRIRRNMVTHTEMKENHTHTNTRLNSMNGRNFRKPVIAAVLAVVNTKGKTNNAQHQTIGDAAQRNARHDTTKDNGKLFTNRQIHTSDD